MNNAMVKSECENIPEQYFYFTNCSDMEKDLCDMEMKYIFLDIIFLIIRGKEQKKI